MGFEATVVGMSSDVAGSIQLNLDSFPGAIRSVGLMESRPPSLRESLSSQSSCHELKAQRISGVALKDFIA